MSILERKSLRNKWICSKEENPLDGVPVLVYVLPFGEYRIAEFIGTQWFYSDGRIFDRSDIVSHWMILPHDPHHLIKGRYE